MSLFRKAVLMLSVLTLLFGATVIARASDSPRYVPGEVIAKFAQGHKPNQSFLNQYGIKSSKRTLGQFVFPADKKMAVRKIGLDRVYNLKLNADEIEPALSKLGRDSRIEYAAPNYLASVDRVSNDPRYAELWGLDNQGQTSGTADADIDAPEAWDVRTGSYRTVGVIDTGVDYTHLDLWSNMWRNPGEMPANNLDDDGNGFIDDVYGYDFVNDDPDPLDDFGHGTHVAGTIGAVGNNGLGVVGINWHARIASIKFLDNYGSGTYEDSVKAVMYSYLMGFTITNNSWGGTGSFEPLYDAISLANSAGQLFIAAAGNRSSNTDTTPHYPSAYDLPNIVSVAATDHKDVLAGFSNYGPVSVDLGAPGQRVLSTVPIGTRVCTLGVPTTSICLVETFTDCTLCDSSGYLLLSGTSMATPHVAGALALFWEFDSALTHMEAKDRLLSTTDPLSTLDGITVSGGRLNVNNLLSS